MELVRTTIPTLTLADFASAHGLVMEVRERPRPEGDPSRYYASFRHAEVKDGPVLSGSYGNGSTPEEAMEAYGREISLKTLVVGAYTPARRVIPPARIV